MLQRELERESRDTEIDKQLLMNRVCVGNAYRLKETIK